MENVLSTQGVTIPKLIYGTAWKEKKTADCVYTAIKCGFRGVDTACQPKHYQEDLVGEGLQRAYQDGLVKREEIFLQTKFTPIRGQDPARLPYDPNAPLDVRVSQSLERSLENLKTSYLDSWVLHSPMDNWQDLLTVWRIFEANHKEGRVKQLGISNCYDPQLFKALCENCEVPPSVIQNRFYSQSDYDCEIREYAISKGVWYQSFWTLTANPHILDSVEITSLAKTYNRTKAQVFFRLLTQIHMTVLTGTTSEIHMKEDLDICSFKLSESEIQTVRNKFGF